MEAEKWRGERGRVNAYLVRIPELRSEYYSGGYEPPEPWFPTGIFCAETPAQAKYDAIEDWAGGTRSGVYHDDWPSLRVNLLRKDVSYERGELNDDESDLWGRVHEVLVDHGGKACDCPEMEWDDTTQDWKEVAA
jgi:hypothetical protein